jgi:hypothetical protein
MRMIELPDAHLQDHLSEHQPTIRLVLATRQEN